MKLSSFKILGVALATSALAVAASAQERGHRDDRSDSRHETNSYRGSSNSGQQPRLDNRRVFGSGQSEGRTYSSQGRSYDYGSYRQRPPSSDSYSSGSNRRQRGSDPFSSEGRWQRSQHSGNPYSSETSRWQRPPSSGGTYSSETSRWQRPPSSGNSYSSETSRWQRPSNSPMYGGQRQSQFGQSPQWNVQERQNSRLGYQQGSINRTPVYAPAGSPFGYRPTSGNHNFHPGYRPNPGNWNNRPSIFPGSVHHEWNHHPEGFWDNGYRVGYVHYNPGWSDANFFFGFYSYNPWDDCVVSPFYWYPFMPAYVTRTRVVIVHDDCISSDWYGDPYEYRRYDDYDAGRPSLDRAIDTLVDSFEHNDRRDLSDLAPTHGRVAIYVNGTYGYSLNADDFYDMLQDEVQNAHTLRYEIVDVRYDRANEAKVVARHTYEDPWGNEATAYNTYFLVREDGRWQIREFGTSDQDRD